jgi:hypothetical protein
MTMGVGGAGRCNRRVESIGGDEVGTIPEQTLSQFLGEAIVPHGFWVADPLPVFEDIRVMAAWRRRTPNTNRGVVQVAFRDRDGDAAGFARAICRPLGRALGYIPFLNEIGLQLVLSGRGILGRAGEVRRAVDRTNSQTVILQSLHLVDLAALDPDPDLPERSEELPDLPRWARIVEALMRLKDPTGGFRFERMRETTRWCHRSRRATLSVRTWGQARAGPLIDSIEVGIRQFLHEAG